MAEMILEANCETGEVFERAITAEEKKARQEQDARVQAQAERDAAAEEVRQTAISKLRVLGLTEEEIASLIKA